MEWISETQWLWWVAAALVLGLIEIASLDLVFTMLATAAIVTAVGAAAGLTFPLQVLLFVATAVLLLAVLRPVALRKLKPLGPAEQTNTAAHVGRRAQVLSEVSDRSGLVKLMGEEWTARTEHAGHALPPGETVEVVRIEGATAFVAPVDTPPGPIHPPAEEDPRA